MAAITKQIQEIENKMEGVRLVEPYERAEILRVLYTYATTPIEERDEAKNFIYRFTHIVKGHDYNSPKHVVRGDNFLVLDGSNEHHVLEDSSFHFTDEQVEEYTGKDRQLFELCEKIEVCE